jgi:hypothetical protein
MNLRDKTLNDLVTLHQKRTPLPAQVTVGGELPVGQGRQHVVGVRREGFTGRRRLELRLPPSPLCENPKRKAAPDRKLLRRIEVTRPHYSNLSRIRPRVA